MERIAPGAVRLFTEPMKNLALALGLFLSLALTHSGVAHAQRHRPRHPHRVTAPSVAWETLGFTELVQGASTLNYRATTTTPVTRLRLDLVGDGCEMGTVNPILDITAIVVTYADGHTANLPAIPSILDGGLHQREIALTGPAAAISSVTMNYNGHFPECWRLRLRVEAAP